jgi:hypothetical protein
MEKECNLDVFWDMDEWSRLFCIVILGLIDLYVGKYHIISTDQYMRNAMFSSTICNEVYSSSLSSPKMLLNTSSAALSPSNTSFLSAWTSTVSSVSIGAKS